MHRLALGLVPVVFVACTGADGPPGAQGSPGTAGETTGAPGVDAGSAAISAISPPTALLERDVAVVISGAGTHFDATSTVDFGPGITVSSTSVVSTAELLCHVHVGADAAVGARDVTVTTAGGALVATKGFEIRPSLGVGLLSAPGAPAQGDIFYLALASLDDQPLASGALSTVSSDPGLSLVPDGTDPGSGLPRYIGLVDTGAAVGANRITWKNPSFLGRTFVSDGSQLAVGARAPAALTPPFSPMNVVFDTRSKAYRLSTSALGILSVGGTPPANLFPAGVLGAASASLSTGMFAASVGLGMALPTRNAATSFDLVLGGVPSVGTDASHTLALEIVHTPIAALTPESGAAHPYNTPQVLTAPAIVDGSFAAVGEDDSYSVTVPAGQSIEFSVTSSTALAWALTTGVAGNPVALPPGGKTLRVANPIGSPTAFLLRLVGASTGPYTVTARVL